MAGAGQPGRPGLFGSSREDEQEAFARRDVWAAVFPTPWSEVSGDGERLVEPLNPAGSIWRGRLAHHHPLPVEALQTSGGSTTSLASMLSTASAAENPLLLVDDDCNHGTHDDDDDEDEDDGGEDSRDRQGRHPAGADRYGLAQQQGAALRPLGFPPDLDSVPGGLCRAATAGRSASASGVGPGQAASASPQRPQQQQQRQQHQQPPLPSDLRRLGHHPCIWGRLRRKFLRSRWILQASDILAPRLQQLGVRLRPATVFYDAVAQEFIALQDAIEQNGSAEGEDDEDAFVDRVRGRLGEALWDARLAPLVKVFWYAARAAARVMGFGRFVGGALGLGRRSAEAEAEAETSVAAAAVPPPTSLVDAALDRLLEHWSRVLVLTDTAVERWLPACHQDQCQGPFGGRGSDTGANRMDCGSEAGDGSAPDEGDYFDEDEGDEGDLDDDDESPADSVGGGDPNFGGTLWGGRGQPQRYSRANDACPQVLDDERMERKQSLPSPQGHPAPHRQQQPQPQPQQQLSSPPFQEQLRERLGSAWFDSVDELLLLQPLMRALADANRRNRVRPADHFFQTCVRLLEEQFSCGAPALPLPRFQQQLRERLGDAWDERLESRQLVRQLHLQAACLRPKTSGPLGSPAPASPPGLQLQQRQQEPDPEPRPMTPASAPKKRWWQYS